MKKLLITAMLLGSLYSNSQTFQKERNYAYIATGADVRNAIWGSDRTNDKAELDLFLKVGATHSGVDISLQYENFRAIDYTGYTVAVNYTLYPIRRLDYLIGVEGGMIDREGNSNFLYYGFNHSLRFHINEWLALQARYNLNYRPDITKKGQNSQFVQSGILEIVITL